MSFNIYAILLKDLHKLNRTIINKNFETKKFLSASDPDMIRVLEDLIQVLINKNLITFEDLPETAQLKLPDTPYF